MAASHPRPTLAVFFALHAGLPMFVSTVRRLALLGLTTLALGAQAQGFRFIAIGDMPYGEPAKVYPQYQALIDTINRRQPAFSLHIGDIKSGSTPCSDELLGQQLAFFQTFQQPVVYTPGDNEWTDCHRKAAGGFDPLERLAHLRRHFFAPVGQSLGAQPLAVQSQAQVMADRFATFVENQRFVRDGVHVLTVHVVGSNNNLEPRDPKAAAEFFERDRANVAWLEDSFQQAQKAQAPAVVVAMQADMFESDFNVYHDERFLSHSGFANVGQTLVRLAKAYGKPVLLVYGDSHQFRVLRPFPKTAPNITALEVFGEKDMHAVEVSVDLAESFPFAFRPVLNPALAR